MTPQLANVPSVVIRSNVKHFCLMFSQVASAAQALSLFSYSNKEILWRLLGLVPTSNTVKRRADLVIDVTPLLCNERTAEQ